jgi:hypothetical protein
MSVDLKLTSEDSFRLRWKNGDFYEMIHVNESDDVREDLAAAIRAIREWEEDAFWMKICNRPRARAHA